MCSVWCRLSEHEVQSRAFEQSMSPPFGAVTNFEGRDALVSLRGSVDDVAALELAAVLDAAIDREPVSMVLELAELAFMGAAGLVVISNAERRLAAMGVPLRIQSPSALMNHLLGMVEEVRIERALPGSAHLGPEQVDGVDVVSQRFGSSLSTQDLRRVAGLPIGSRCGRRRAQPRGRAGPHEHR